LSKVNNLTNTSIKRRLSSLATFYKHLNAFHGIEHNPLRDYAYPKAETKEIVYLTSEQTIKLLEGVLSNSKKLQKTKTGKFNHEGEPVYEYKPVDLTPEEMRERLLADSVRFASFRYPFVIDSIMPGQPAALAGLQPGDSITQLDGRNIAYFDFKEEMLNRQKAANDSTSRLLTLTYVRAGVADTVKLTTDSLYQIGVAASLQTNKLLPVVKKEYSFFASIPAGVTLGVNTLKGYVSQMKYLFSKEGAKQLGGFGTIGSIFPATWDWYQFWYMTAFLSIILAFMNILPIPALDGGHVLFLIYEIVARRKPSDKFMERAQMVGMFLLFGLLIWANFNDVLRFFF